MDQREYDYVRTQSSALFGNAAVVPIAWVIRDLVTDQAFGTSEVRERLGGRLATGPIREALARLDAIGAVKELPYPGKPHPRTWQLESGSPFWPFLAAWIGKNDRTHAVKS